MGHSYNHVKVVLVTYSDCFSYLSLVFMDSESVELRIASENKMHVSLFLTITLIFEAHCSAIRKRKGR